MKQLLFILILLFSCCSIYHPTHCTSVVLEKEYNGLYVLSTEDHFLYVDVGTYNLYEVGDVITYRYQDYHYEWRAYQIHTQPPPKIDLEEITR